jgi:hypothetical protein
MQLSEWSWEQLMFIDETAFHERTLDRKFGWSGVNTRARRIQPLKRTKKWSVLPLYTCDGFADWEIIHGSFNKDLFVAFVEDHVIPHTTPYPGKNSILIMDNCKIHRDDVFKSSLHSTDNI